MIYLRIVCVVLVMLGAALSSMSFAAETHAGKKDQEPTSVQVVDPSQDTAKNADAPAAVEAPAAQSTGLENLVPVLVPSQIAEKIDLDSHVRSLAGQYDNWLIKSKLVQSFEGKMIASAIILVLGIAVWIGIRMLTRSADRKLQRIQEKYALYHRRFRLYTRMVRILAVFCLIAATLYTIGTLWDVTSWGFVTTQSTVKLLGSVMDFAFLLVIAVMLWEFVDAMIEHVLRHANGGGRSRARTLLPVIRNIARTVFIALFGLVFLSQIGINIMPLLAGAGIVGVAIGFGAQAMVRDFITGFTIILEDIVQVGDVAKMADRAGVIEKITLRKVQLRDANGTVYTIPFSEVKVIENMTKDFSFFVADIAISWRQNIDDALRIIKQVGDAMQVDPTWGPFIQAPIEIQGVDRFTDAAVILKIRIRTQAMKQWDIGRAFNRELKMAFDQYGIETPAASRTVYVATERMNTQIPNNNEGA